MMPVIKCPNGKFRIGRGKCVFNSHADAQKAMVAMFAHRNDESTRQLMSIAGVTDRMIDQMMKAGEDKNG